MRLMDTAFETLDTIARKAKLPQRLDVADALGFLAGARLITAVRGRLDESPFDTTWKLTTHGENVLQVERERRRLS